MSFIRCASSLNGGIVLIPYHKIAKILNEANPDAVTRVQTVDGVILYCADENGNTKHIKLKDSVVTYGCCNCVQEGTAK